jgi:TPR repeat protein
MAILTIMVNHKKTTSDARTAFGGSWMLLLLAFVAMTGGRAGAYDITKITSPFELDNIGDNYYLGIGVPQDYTEALKWYQKSADAGDDYAEFNIGKMYEKGQGVQQNYAKALAWYQKAADQGFSTGMIAIGELYQKGLGVPRDYAKAIKLYQNAADKQNTDAWDDLGHIYQYGLGVPQDYSKAIEWYQKAANKNSPSGEYDLAYMYEHGLGVPQDYDKALHFYGWAAGMNYADAKLALRSLRSQIAHASNATPPTGQVNESRVALVVGNGAYLHVPHLINPGNDAQLVASTLLKDDFQIVDNHALKDLDKSAFESALHTFGDQIQHSAAQHPTVALFYFAGHGIERQGVNYLVPISADPHRGSDVPLETIPLEEVLEQMADAGARLKILILDACRNDPFGDRGLRDVAGGLAQIQAPDGTLISFSTRPGGVAEDGEGPDSFYAEAFVETIREPGLDIFNTFNKVSVMVRNKTDHAQTPWTDDSAIEGKFYFAGDSRR